MAVNCGGIDIDIGMCFFDGGDTFRGFSLAERSFGEKQRVQVSFTVTNKGGTTATVTDTGAAIIFVQSTPLQKRSAP